MGHMDSDDPQTRRMLEETRILIKEAAEDVDRRAQNSIYQKKMRRMYERFSVQKGVNLDLNNFITPTRKFECEMQVDILDSTAKKNAKKGMHLLLFSDYLVLANPKKSGVFDLDGELVVTFASPIKMFNVRDTEDKRCIALMRHRHVGQQTGTDRVIIRFNNPQQQKSFKDHQLACQQMVFRAEANLSDRRAGMTKNWATTKTQYLKNKSSSQSLTDQLDNMANNYRNMSPVSGTADPKTLEVLADTLARAERAESELRRLRAAATQIQEPVRSQPAEMFVGIGPPMSVSNEMDLL